MVVSSSPYASDIGRKILEDGGNAVDAAIAVGFALEVSHPSAGNLGGGGFMTLHLGQSGEDFTVDYREMAPGAAYREMYLDSEGKLVPGSSIRGHRASGVPGTVAGLHLAWKRWGSLPWARLVEPARRLAESSV